MIKKIRQKLKKLSKKKGEEQDTGFTLIEMLVVIAIIAILSSVAYTAVGSARAKATDKAIIASLEGMRLIARSIYEKNGCYAASVEACTGFLERGVLVTIDGHGAYDCRNGSTMSAYAGTHYFDSDPKIKAALRAVADHVGNVPYSVSCKSSVGGADWVISATLKSDPSKRWCVDSKGNSRLVTPGTFAYPPILAIPPSDFGFTNPGFDGISHCKSS